MRILPLLLLSCLAVAAEPTTSPAEPAPAAQAATPGYKDVQPVVEAALRALDAGDADALFRHVSPLDLRQLDEKELQEAKKGITGERIVSLRGVLAQLATIQPVYHADLDALEFAITGNGSGFWMQRVEGAWYITNHPPKKKAE